MMLVSVINLIYLPWQIILTSHQYLTLFNSKYNYRFALHDLAYEHKNSKISSFSRLNAIF